MKGKRRKKGWNEGRKEKGGTKEGSYYLKKSWR